MLALARKNMQELDPVYKRRPGKLSAVEEILPWPLGSLCHCL